MSTPDRIDASAVRCRLRTCPSHRPPWLNRFQRRCGIAKRKCAAPPTACDRIASQAHSAQRAASISRRERARQSNARARGVAEDQCGNSDYEFHGTQHAMGLASNDADTSCDRQLFRLSAPTTAPGSGSALQYLSSRSRPSASAARMLTPACTLKPVGLALHGLRLRWSNRVSS